MVTDMINVIQKVVHLNGIETKNHQDEIEKL